MNRTLTGNASFNRKTKVNSRRIISIATMAALAVCCLASCGSGSGSGSVQNQQTTYTIGGTVSGLSGSGLVLQDNGGNNLTVATGASNFTFSTSLASGSSYSVTVLTQPSNPAQTCTVSNGSGSVGTANITGVQVACSTNTYSIGGTIAGLTGTGLVLQNNSGNNLSIAANASSFTFTSSVASGKPYAVTVLTQPSSPAQVCTVNNGNGTVVNANITNVQIACTASQSTYTIGGTITGLSGSGLVLQDNGTNNLSVGSGANSFTFSTALASGSAYNVTVLTEPSSPAQTCAVTNGSGTVASSNVTSVQIACTTTAVNYTISGSISGLSGSGLVLQDNGGNNLSLSAGATTFTFSLAIASGDAYNVTVLTQPSNPVQTCTVTNGSGTVGSANVTNVVVGCNQVSGLNEWTWVGGSDSVNHTATYGTLGIPAAGNFPGARNGSATWTDAEGNLWLFGGALDLLGPTDYIDPNFYNDLWKYSNGEWTWMGGSQTANSGGTYGTQGVPAQSNVPPGREWAATWVDKSGNLWLFGGFGYNRDGISGGGPYNLDDLWEYSAGEWTWVGGTDGQSSGTYGTLGVPASGNFPPGRYGATTWTDTDGSFWLFGGASYNDLWKYTAGEWTWMGGSDGPNSALGIYGTIGVPAPGNFPGARAQATGWEDPDGDFWLFGGYGSDAVGTSAPNGYFGAALNDLWKYSAGEWTWVAGSNIALQSGSYGSVGVTAASNAPGARWGGVGWTDLSGNLWLFGGGQFSATGQGEDLNDLWVYSAGEWTWMSGSNIANQSGSYEILGVPEAGISPGARTGAVGWTDTSGNLWLFGGLHIPQLGENPFDNFNDLWEYAP